MDGQPISWHCYLFYLLEQVGFMAVLTVPTFSYMKSTRHKFNDHSVDYLVDDVFE